MSGFEKEIDRIYRLRFPFDTVFTSVFLIIDEEARVLVDTGAGADDVDRYILPALFERGIAPSDLTALVLTHRHTDHAAGLDRLLEICPSLPVITSPGVAIGRLITYALPGHTEDMLGLLDTRTHTLITGDALQGDGVDKYRCSLWSKEAYFETLSRIAEDPQIENLLFSHAYEPWRRASIRGREETLAVLSDCRRAAK